MIKANTKVRFYPNICTSIAETTDEVDKGGLLIWLKVWQSTDMDPLNVETTVFEVKMDWLLILVQ